jgi:hypothetical protein
MNNTKSHFLDRRRCKGEGCACKTTCYRFTKPDEYTQSYFVESPIVKNGCEYYINHNKI